VANEKYGVFAKCFCSEIPVPGLLETLYCLFFVLKCTNISKVADTIYQKLSLYLAYPLSVSGFYLYDSSPVPGLLETLYCLFFVLKCTNISKVADTIY
jgi:hypothetical protein